MPTSIDVNCDLGESFGIYTLGMDEEVMPYISSANIACGWHAGDPVVMERTVRSALRHQVRCGAHPGYPDLLGFGRRAMQVDGDELSCYLIYQIGALAAFCRANQTELHHVKPHGSLYHAAVADEGAARAVASAIIRVDPTLVFVTFAGEKGEMMARIGREYGLSVAREAFPDRAYTAEGVLAPRSQPGAVITDPEEVIRRGVKIAAEGCIEAISGELIPLAAQTLCVHGDNPKAVAMVRQLRTALAEKNIAVAPLNRAAAA
jgi:5-oxoprolinase (ATP-hydrolysing) subunit A